jgi:hypothetical protein
MHWNFEIMLLLTVYLLYNVAACKTNFLPFILIRSYRINVADCVLTLSIVTAINMLLLEKPTCLLY